MMMDFCKALLLEMDHVIMFGYRGKNYYLIISIQNFV